MTTIIAKNTSGNRYMLKISDDGVRVSEITATGKVPLWIQKRIQTYSITKPYILNAIALLRAELITRGELETIIT